MIILEKIDNCNSEDYNYTENLLLSTFPREEHRDIPLQRKNVEENNLFTLYIAKDNAQRIGMITCWRLDGICYIEHFAIDAAMRGKGYGAKVLQKIKELFPKIVLEVERPTEEIKRRRIAFYQRQGFSLCENDYMQPPYRKGDEPLPMYLMFHGCKITPSLYEETKDNIHKNVYNRQFNSF